MLDYGNKTIEEERKFRKNQLAAAFRIFSKFGFDNGVTGHITVRDPEFTDSYWVNPYMMHFSHIKSSDLVRVNETGEVVEGNREVNKAALVIHSAVHKERPDAIAAAHAHTTYGQVWATTGKKIKPLTQDSCAFYNDLTLFDDYTGVVRSDLVRVNETGEVVEGNREVNKAALVIHSAVHKERPDAIAAAHAHTTYGQVWATTGKKIKPLTQDSCAFYNDLTLFDDYTGVVYEGEEGERIARALEDKK